ncbi:glucokinase [Roseivirga pacifica]|jgi:glucokinase|uniref:Glucokinase n=1 Tax=Roseivirga pacifica TaxID=1267423 RepID=A0A1I0NJB6_9BACT|nr:ROK family protein [Roseivirga pacifica]MCO6359772.1 ROK family protein [Roseivirga pacifica]MCO6367142.1 ROK family protein [Roseivirga pacifica]MCO6370326.1 ROK family protein [Roseivirga pacifica]MCO6374799.1 ROK family protein [Roseivirga pacifica]MCO6380057.1 ROK family protein [Roseivirga pacifica]
MRQTALGIDIGGTFTKFGLSDIEGNILMEGSIPTYTHKEIDQFLEALSTAIKENLDKILEPIDIIGVGIGAPNGNYYNGTIEHAPNLHWKGIIPFIDLFQKHFDLPMIMTNDANAAAIGEKVFGGAKDMNDFIVVTLGTGLGSGFVTRGKLIYGHDGLAGELGHTNVYPDGRECNCGKRGCLETYASASGIKRTVFKLLATNNVDTPLRNYTYESLSSKKITEMALQGDPIALEAYEYTSDILGLKLADAAAVTSPETIFLFGGLAKAGDILIEATKKAFNDYLYPGYKGKIQIKLSELMDKNAAVLGASALVWSEIAQSDIIRVPQQSRVM